MLITKKRRFTLLTGVMACWLGLAAGAAAQETAQEIDYFSLPLEQLINAEIVSVSKKSEKVSDAAAAIFVLTNEDIKRAGVTNIPDALRMVPGVQVAQSDSNTWAISIRGFNNTIFNKLLILVDGRTVYNPLFGGTYWELREMMLDDIDRIEVIRGPGGTLWGANAVNGVINVITKHSRDTQGNLVTGLYGNEEEGTVEGRHGGDFGFGNYYRVYARYFNRDSFRQPGGGDAEDEWQGSRAGFRADWGDDFTLQGDVYRVLTEQMNTSFTIAPLASLVEKETMDSEGANIIGRWKKDMNDGALWMVQSYLDYTARNQILLKDKRGIFDIETQYNFPLQGRHEIIAGGGYRYSHDKLSSSPTVTFSPSSRGDNLFNFFAQDKIALIEDSVYLTLGSKFEHNDYTGFEVQPNARLQWHPDETQTLWTAVSRAVRTPTRLEHDLNQTIAIFGGLPVILSANDDFDIEKLVAYEAGYRKQVNPDMAVDLAIFYNDYDDLATIGFLPIAGGIFPIEAVNGMKAEAYGAEIAADWSLTQKLKLSASYTLLNIAMHVDDDSGFDLETGEDVSPHHQASLRASYNITDDVSLDASAYYVDQLAQSNVGDYVRVDMNLGWRIDDGVRFNLVGQNLLDDAHREYSSSASLNAAEVERSVFGKLTWEF
jgi:iron complex outermembrane receptor protein